MQHNAHGPHQLPEPNALVRIPAQLMSMIGQWAAGFIADPSACSILHPEVVTAVQLALAQAGTEEKASCVAAMLASGGAGRPAKQAS